MVVSKCCGDVARMLSQHGRKRQCLTQDARTHHAQVGIVQSVVRAESCHDPSPAQSFWVTLKGTLVSPSGAKPQPSWARDHDLDHTRQRHRASQLDREHRAHRVELNVCGGSTTGRVIACLVGPGEWLVWERGRGVRQTDIAADARTGTEGRNILARVSATVRCDRADRAMVSTLVPGVGCMWPVWSRSARL